MWGNVDYAVKKRKRQKKNPTYNCTTFRCVLLLCMCYLLVIHAVCRLYPALITLNAITSHFSYYSGLFIHIGFNVCKISYHCGIISLTTSLLLGLTSSHSSLL